MEKSFDIPKGNNSYEQFEALFTYSTIGIIITNKSGEIININTLAENQFGYTKEELVGEKIEILIPENYRPRHEGYRDNFYDYPHNRGMGTGRDLFAKRKDGTTFPVEISLSHYEMEHNLFVIAFIIDITIRKANEEMMISQKKELEKKAEEIFSLNVELEGKVEDRTKMLKETLNELEISKQELSEALKNEKEVGDLKSGFVTMASHEFRTPLSTILSSVSLLAKYTNTEEQDKRDKHIHRIKDAVDNLKNILEDFLSLGKLEEGSVHTKIEETDMKDAIHEIQNFAHDMQPLCKVGQRIELESSGSGLLYIDMKLLKSILINLISNAIKFSSENSQILIKMVLQEKELLVSVKDFGIGISKEDQEHLFERFFRAKNAINIQGTGLGLNIVGKYVELLNGRIELHSQLNKGSEITIYLPRTSTTN